MADSRPDLEEFATEFGVTALVTPSTGAAFSATAISGQRSGARLQTEHADQGAMRPLGTFSFQRDEVSGRLQNSTFTISEGEDAGDWKVDRVYPEELDPAYIVVAAHRV